MSHFVQSSFIYLNLSAGVFFHQQHVPDTFLSRLPDWNGSLELVRETEATKPFSGIIRGIFAAKGLDLTQPEPEKSQCISETLSAAVCVETCFFSAFQLLRRNVIFQKVSHWVRNEPSEAGIWSLRVWRGLLHPEQEKTSSNPTTQKSTLTFWYRLICTVEIETCFVDPLAYHNICNK